jgi:hypothetical protein
LLVLFTFSPGGYSKHENTPGYIKRKIPFLCALVGGGPVFRFLFVLVAQRTQLAGAAADFQRISADLRPGQ